MLIVLFVCSESYCK